MPLYNWGRAYATAGGGSGNNILLDGTPVTAMNGSASTLALPSMTASAGSYIVVFIAANGAGPAASNPITATGLTFTYLGDNGAANPIWGYIAKAASSFTGVITINTTAVSYVEAIAAAYSGAVSSSVQDGSTATSTTNSVSITTTNAADAIIVGARNGSGSGAGIDAALSPTVTAQYMWSGYQLATSTGTFTYTDTTTTANGFLAIGLKST